MLQTLDKSDRGATTRPASASPPLTGLAGLISLVAGFFYVAVWPPENTTIALVILVLACGVPMFALEVYLNREALFFRRRLAPPNPGRVAAKLCGLVVTYAAIALVYWTFPIYREDQATVFVALFPYFGWPLIVLAAPYIWLTDRVMEQPEDGLYAAGCAALGQWDQVDRKVLGQYVLGWTVKAFFLPMMLLYSWHNVNLLMPTSPMELISKQPYGWYEFGYNMMYFIDVTFACVGYACTLRLLNLHIRWAESTMFGWVVCIICYAPFADTLFKSYIPYAEDDHGWGYWFGSATTLGSVWAGIILVMLAVYVWATVIFGLRFSNLTNRGIITNGPYRWVKHPAYTFKILAYAMINLPFLHPGTWLEALRCMLMFTVLALIYYMRARAEEAYLMKDPVYRDYAEWISRNGAWAILKRLALGRVAQPS